MTNSASRSRPRARMVWWCLLIVIVVVAVYWWQSSQTAGGHSAPKGRPGMMGMMGAKVPVRAAQTRFGQLPVLVPAIGTVQAFNVVTVRSRVEGELVDIAFDDGQWTEEGALLAQIDPRAYQIRLDQAKAQLVQNEAQLRLARLDLDRYKRLSRQDSISLQQLQNQEASVQQLQGAVQASKAGVDEAQLQLDYTRITAPLSGRLGLRTVDKGNLVSAGSTEGLVVITQTQPITTHFSLPQQDLQRVLEAVHEHEMLASTVLDNGEKVSTPIRASYPGMVTVTVSNRNGELLATGELMAIDNQIDVNTGTVRIKAKFENEDHQLFPNQFVNVKVLLGQQDGVIVPARAVQSGSIGDYVYVINEQSKVSVRAIQTGVTNDVDTVVLNGLEAGEHIVTEGMDRLREGAEVDVIAPEGSKQ